MASFLETGVREGELPNAHRDLREGIERLADAFVPATAGLVRDIPPADTLRRD